MRTRMSPASRRSPSGHYKMDKVMAEWKAGTLRSSSGQPVTNQHQAIAIGLSEQRRYNRARRPK